ncbi:MAG: hypothetical protein RDU13_12510 [Elusimicrobiales bacterium]|nr:hypothetical protein [Elusimicrobiales bacterium]
MKRTAISLSIAAGLCFPPQATGRAITCGGPDDNEFCRFYAICRSVLEEYPESEITEKGVDCTLTVGRVQLIIRRKKTEEGIGYFWYRKRLPEPGNRF